MDDMADTPACGDVCGYDGWMIWSITANNQNACRGVRPPPPNTHARTRAHTHTHTITCRGVSPPPAMRHARTHRQKCIDIRIDAHT